MILGRIAPSGLFLEKSRSKFPDPDFALGLRATALLELGGLWVVNTRGSSLPSFPVFISHPPDILAQMSEASDMSRPFCLPMGGAYRMTTSSCVCSAPAAPFTSSLGNCATWWP